MTTEVTANRGLLDESPSRSAATSSILLINTHRPRRVRDATDGLRAAQLRATGILS